MLPCPSCGFLTLEGDRYGSGSECPVCRWKDDGEQLANPCTEGGANGRSLLEFQVEASEVVPLLFHEFKGWFRDPAWRPLSKDEVSFYVNYRNHDAWFFRKIEDPDRVYWRGDGGG